MNPCTVRWAVTPSRQLRELGTDMRHDGYCACHLPSHKHLKAHSASLLLKHSKLRRWLFPCGAKGAKWNESGLLGSCGDWHGFLRLLTFLSAAVFTTFTVIIRPVHQVFSIRPQWCVRNTSIGEGENRARSELR